MCSSWSARNVKIHAARTKDHIQERIGDENEETLHGADLLEFLKQAQIKRCICLSIGYEDGLGAVCPPF